MSRLGGHTVAVKDYWRTVRRRWRSVVACLLLALAAAGVLTWQATPQYASSAQLFISTTPSDSADAYQGGLFASQRVTSYADLVGTRDLAQRVSESLAEGVGEAPDPGTLTESVSASVVPDTVILEITATDPDPVVARDIAQAYAEELTALVAEVEDGEDRDQQVIRASMVDDARVPTTPDSPRPLRTVGIALVLGLLVGFGLAVVRDLLDTSVSGPPDVAEVTTAPLVGTIPDDPSTAETAADRAVGDSSAWAEAFRVLRTNLRYLQVDHDTKAVVITSALPEEGKTTIAADLAVTLALAGHRVALLECDLRRPRVASRLGLDDAVGTTSVLVGHVSLDDALQPYGDTGLQVLTSGPIPPNPSELLQSQAMTRLLEEARSRFDVLLVDAPPLLPVTDAAPLAAATDGAVVVVRHRRTTRDQLADALGRLASVEAETLGVVLTRVPARGMGAGYGYGHGYGYGSTPAVEAGAVTAPAEPAAPVEQEPAREPDEKTDPAARKPPAQKSAPRKTAARKSAAGKTPAGTSAAGKSAARKPASDVRSGADPAPQDARPPGTPTLRS